MDRCAERVSGVNISKSKVKMVMRSRNLNRVRRQDKTYCHAEEVESDWAGRCQRRKKSLQKRPVPMDGIKWFMGFRSWSQ